MSDIEITSAHVAELKALTKYMNTIKAIYVIVLDEKLRKIEIHTNSGEVLFITANTFDVLSTLPDWYQYLLFLAVSASFGIRGADKLMKLRAK